MQQGMGVDAARQGFGASIVGWKHRNEIEEFSLQGAEDAQNMP